MLGTSPAVDLSFGRLVAEADVAKHLQDVRGEELARVRKERDDALKEAEKRFNDAATAFTKASEKLQADLSKRGLVPAR